MPLPASPVWFITGCSTGLGRALAKLTIARGWPTVVTARDVSRVAELGEGQSQVLPLALDVTDKQQVDAAARQAEHIFGRVDVLVNNAGYGYQSSIEEADDQAIRDQFEANTFGVFDITRALLPGMRQRRAGHIINITSVAGLLGLPGSGFYAASKHAIEGFSDALAAEVGPLGIQVTCVEPGPFRTDWAGRSLKQTPSHLQDYAHVTARMRTVAEGSGKQAGDPVRAGEALIRLSETDNAPRHLVLGARGFNVITAKLRERLEQIERWRETSLSADFPA